MFVFFAVRLGILTSDQGGERVDHKSMHVEHLRPLFHLGKAVIYLGCWHNLNNESPRLTEAL